MGFTVDKHIVKKSVIRHFKLRHPEYLDELNSTRFKLGFAWIDGFLCCLSISGEDPIQQKDLDDLVVSELIKFLIEDISNG